MSTGSQPFLKAHAVMAFIARRIEATDAGDLGPPLNWCGSLLDDTQRELERQIRRWQDSAPDSFTAHDCRVALACVKAVAQGLEDRLVDRERGTGALVEAGEASRGLGLDHLEEQIGRLSEHFEGHVRTVNLRAVGKTPDEALLERFETSVRSYGFDGVKAIQRELAQAQLRPFPVGAFSSSRVFCRVRGAIRCGGGGRNRRERVGWGAGVSERGPVDARVPRPARVRALCSGQAASSSARDGSSRRACGPSSSQASQKRRT